MAQLLTTSREFAGILDKAGQVVMILLDFRVHFRGRVPHTKLIFTLQVASPFPEIVNRNHSYLVHRKQFVEEGGC